MTMPHLMKCDHAESGWCLDCVIAQQATVERLSEALTELRDALKDHPAYGDLTEDEEIEIGGDTAEFSYLVRVADNALKGKK